MSISPSSSQDPLFEIKFAPEHQTIFYIKTSEAKKIETIGLSLQHGFKEAIDQCFECRDFSPRIFKATVAIAEGSDLKVVFKPEDLQKLETFEDLGNCLSFFYPRSVAALSQKILNQMTTMTFETAEALQKNRKNFSFEPLLAEKRIEVSAYFRTKEESDLFAQKVNHCLYAYLKARKECIETPELPFVQENELRDLILKKLEENLKDCQKELEDLRHSASGQFNVSQKVGDRNFLIHRKAVKAKEKINAYIKTLKKAFEDSQSNMQSPCLQYILGPPFLFDHYGIVPKKKNTNEDRLFCYVPALQKTCTPDSGLHTYLSTFNYGLSIDLPEELEKVIRSRASLETIPDRFRRLENKIPEALFPEKKIDEHFDLKKLYNSHAIIGLFKKDPIAQKIPRVLNLLPFSFSEEEAFKRLGSERFFTLANMVSIIADKKLKDAIYFSNREEVDAWFAENHLPADFSIKRGTPQAISSASIHFQSKNPRIRASAVKARKLFTKYVNSILKTLQASGANMSRVELLRPLITPNYLFSYYGLFPLLVDGKRSFIRIRGCENTCKVSKKLHLIPRDGFTFLLKNPDAPNLQQEIRHKLGL